VLGRRITSLGGGEERRRGGGKWSEARSSPASRADFSLSHSKNLYFASTHGGPKRRKEKKGPGKEGEGKKQIVVPIWLVLFFLKTSLLPLFFSSLGGGETREE